MRAVLSLALLASACASEQPCSVRTSAELWGAWCEPPTVIVDERAPCALEQVQAALDVWSPITDGFALELGPVPPVGAEYSGEIYVSVGQAPGPAWGRSERTRASSGALDHVRVTVETCEAWLLAHEIGHALGYQHSADPSHLMHDAERGAQDPWVVPPALLALYRAALTP